MNETTIRLNKILKCRHVFDSKQGDIPTEFLLTCRECFLNARVEVISYEDHDTTK